MSNPLFPLFPLVPAKKNRSQEPPAKDHYYSPSAVEKRKSVSRFTTFRRKYTSWALLFITLCFVFFTGNLMWTFAKEIYELSHRSKTTTLSTPTIDSVIAYGQANNYSKVNLTTGKTPVFFTGKKNNEGKMIFTKAEVPADTFDLVTATNLTEGALGVAGTCATAKTKIRYCLTKDSNTMVIHLPQSVV